MITVSKKKTNPIYDQRGMSVLNVLIAAAIGVIVLSGITLMITDVFKSQRTIQSKDAQRELNSSIQKLLSDPLICAASFGGENPVGTGFTRTQIIDTAAPPNIKYQTGVNYLNNLVTLTGFEVKNFLADNEPVDPKKGKSELNIKMNKIGSIVGSIQMTTTIFLQTTLDASNKISACYALGVADSLWQISPDNIADIYYQGGNVGIGTVSPSSKLDVNGNAIVTGTLKINDETVTDSTVKAANALATIMKSCNSGDIITIGTHGNLVCTSPPPPLPPPPHHCPHLPCITALDLAQFNSTVTQGRERVKDS